MSPSDNRGVRQDPERINGTIHGELSSIGRDPHDPAERVLAALRDRGTSHINDLATSAGVPHRLVLAVLQGCCARGSVLAVEGGKYRALPVGTNQSDPKGVDRDAYPEIENGVRMLP